MEERVSTWENAFVLRAMKETNVKLVSSISVCLLSLTSTYSHVSVWMMKCYLLLLGSQQGSHMADWGPWRVRCRMPSNEFPTDKFDSLLDHLIPYLVLFLLVTGLGNNPQAVSMQVILCGRQMCCCAKPMWSSCFQKLQQFVLVHSRLGLSPHVRKDYYKLGTEGFGVKGGLNRKSWELSLNLLSCIHMATWKSVSQTSKDLLFSEV